MKNVLLIVFALIGYSSFSQSKVYQELDSLAESLGMEFVHGNKFPAVNPYGSYGATAVFNFLNVSDKSVLFLCRKKNQYHQKKELESIYDLVRHYDYSLVFAFKYSNGTYKICDVLSEGIGLKGLSLYYGSSDFQLSEFIYLDNPQEKGPNGMVADYSNGCVPIVISSDNVTSVLYYYNNRWLEFVERYN